MIITTLASYQKVLEGLGLVPPPALLLSTHCFCCKYV
jgi:hypothetical protein